MSRVSRSPTLMPTGFASTRRDMRAVDLIAVAAAIQAPKRDADHGRVLEVELVHEVEIEIGEIVDRRHASAAARSGRSPDATARSAGRRGEQRRAPAPSARCRCRDAGTGAAGRGRARSARVRTVDRDRWSVERYPATFIAACALSCSWPPQFPSRSSRASAPMGIGGGGFGNRLDALSRASGIAPIPRVFGLIGVRLPREFADGRSCFRTAFRAHLCDP